MGWNKSCFSIAVLCLLLGVLTVRIFHIYGTVENKENRAAKIIVEENLTEEALMEKISKEALSEKTLTESDDTAYYPNLIAPDREVKSLVDGERICYLTFDDGPSENTEIILDILKENEIKATFFVVGESLTEERKAIMERIIEEGHAIGMHANVHNYEKLYASLESFLADYDALYEQLKTTYGIETALYRFPGGSACICLNGNGKTYVQEMAKRGFSCFDWNISGEDSVGSPTVSSIQRNVLTKGLECRRAYVLLHDSNVADQTAAALPEIIKEFREEGFVFESLENAESYVFPISR